MNMRNMVVTHIGFQKSLTFPGLSKIKIQFPGPNNYKMSDILPASSLLYPLFWTKKFSTNWPSSLRKFAALHTPLRCNEDDDDDVKETNVQITVKSFSLPSVAFDVVKLAVL